MPARPGFYWLLLLLIPAAAVMVRQYLQGREDLSRLCGSWRPREFYDLYTVKWFFSSLGFALFIVFSVLALVGFPGEEYPVGYDPRGADVVFLVDVSESMKAADIEPSRLEASARIVQAVCGNVSAGRFGVVVFKGRGVKIVPVTEDLESVNSFMRQLSTDVLTTPGTDLASGLEAALSAFPSGEERVRTVVLLSDGEALSGDLEPVLKKAEEMDVRIAAVGMGTADGAGIPLASGGYVLGSSGAAVTTRLDEQTLESVAARTGGSYFGHDESQLIGELIRLCEASGAEGASEGFIMKRGERYRFFAGLALLGLLLSQAVRVVKWKNMF